MGTTLSNGGKRLLHGWDVLRADLKPCPEFFDQGGFAQVNYPGLTDGTAFVKYAAFPPACSIDFDLYRPAPNLVNFQLTRTVAAQQCIYNGDRSAADFVTKSAAGDPDLMGMVLC